MDNCLIKLIFQLKRDKISSQFISFSNKQIEPSNLTKLDLKLWYNRRRKWMTLRHPGISPTNDLVAKKIFSNPEITCQFIRDMLDLPAKNVTILEGSNIHVLPSLPYSAQDFYTSIDVLAELDNGTQVIIEIQVHHQNFFINRLWAYLCAVRSIKTLKKFANKKAILTRAINTSHQYTLSLSQIVITSKMIQPFTVLVCEKTRQVRS